MSDQIPTSKTLSRPKPVFRDGGTVMCIGVGQGNAVMVENTR